MTIDNYAEMLRRTGTDTIKIQNIWWRKVRPFFYRPLLPYQIYDPLQLKVNLNKMTSFQHVVSIENQHNSYMNFLIFDRLKNYNSSILKKDDRKKIKRALKNNLTVHQITSREKEEFIKKAFTVYLSFYGRTKYSYRKDRTNKEKFVQWLYTIFNFPGTLVIGVFKEEVLLSFEIAILIEDTLIYQTSINSKLGLKFHSPDLGLHFWREKVSKRSGINMIYAGYYLSEEGINMFKIQRGARVVAYPAYLYINPFLLLIAKNLRKRIYEKLMGMNEQQLRERISILKS
jgi:hypothetical protein